MTATAPIYFDHELKVQQSDVDAKFMAHCGFNKIDNHNVMDKPVTFYEHYFSTDWHDTADQARNDLRSRLELAGWSTPG